MRFFKKCEENEIKVNVGDRILRSIKKKKERKWWEEHSRAEFLIIESVIKEISPSGDYYCLTENEQDIWVRRKNLAILEVLNIK